MQLEKSFIELAIPFWDRSGSIFANYAGVILSELIGIAAPDNRPCRAAESGAKTISYGVWHPLAIVPLQVAALLNNNRRA